MKSLAYGWDLELSRGMKPVSLRPLLIFLTIPLALLAQEKAIQTPPGTWPVDRLKSEVPVFRVEDDKARIQSLLYEGEVVSGTPTEVFAFYASPKTLIWLLVCQQSR